MDTKQHFKICLYVIKLGTIICRAKKVIILQYLEDVIMYLMYSKLYISVIYMYLKSKENQRRY